MCWPPSILCRYIQLAIIAMYECQICKQYARKSLKEILHHIRDVHRSFSTPVSCGVNDCPSTASSYESLRQHLYKKHRDALFPENTAEGAVAHEVDDIPNIDEYCLQLDGNDLDAETACRPSSCKTEAAKYILRVRDGKGLTQVVTDGIMRDVDTLIDCVTENLERKIIAKLAEMPQLSSREIADIQAIFSVNSSIFDGLDTVCKQEAFFAENFNYVVRHTCVYASITFTII